MSRNGAVALGYARRGWAVLPIHQPTPKGCACSQEDCSSPAKHPKIGGGLTNASLDRAVIGQWWRRWPAANVAVRTGRESGLVVVDIDPAHGGTDALAELEGAHAPVGGWKIRTGSGGEHRWFAHPGTRVANSAGRIGDGIDIRADGGYIIAPPSTHISGGDYTWVDARGPLPHLPKWLAERLVEPIRTPPDPALRSRLSIGRHTDCGAWARAALVMEVDLVRRAGEGQRNATLNRAAFSLGQIAGAGLLDEYTVTETLADAASGAGLAEREARRTIASGLRAGMAHPRAPTTGVEPTLATIESSADVVEMDL